MTVIVWFFRTGRRGMEKKREKGRIKKQRARSLIFFFLFSLSSMKTSADAMAIDDASTTPPANGLLPPGGSRFRLELVAELVGHDGRCWGVDWSPEGKERKRTSKSCERSQSFGLKTQPPCFLPHPTPHPHPHPTQKNYTGDTLASCGADRTVRTWHQLRSSSSSSSSGGRTGGGGGGAETGGGGGGGRWGPDAVLEESQARAVRAVAWAPPPAAAAAAAAAAASVEGKRNPELLRRRQRRTRRLAAASFDASIAVWEEERLPPPQASGESEDIENEGDDDDEPTLWSQVALLQGHESEVKGVAWSPLPGATEAESSEGEEDEDEADRGDDDADGGGGSGDERPLSSSSSPPPPHPPPPPPPSLLGDGEGCLLATCGRDRSVWLWESVPSSSSSGAGIGGIGGGSGGAYCEFECVDVKQGHAGDVKSVAWHPSGSVLASCSYDGTVRLWAPEGGASEEGIGGGGIRSGATAANAAAVGDEWLCAQEVKNAHGGETVWSLAFEPRQSGKKKRKNRAHVRAASCGGDGRVSVWSCPLPRASEGEPAAETLRWRAGAVARSAAPPSLGGRVRPAYSVDWSSCGGWIASGGGDDCVRVFRAPPPAAEDGGEEEGEEAGREGGEEAEREGGGEEEEEGGGGVVLELAAEARPSPPCEVNCVKWRPRRRKNDLPMLAAACDDGVVRLWRLEEQRK